MRVMIIILMLLWGCTKIDICDPDNYPDPPFGEPDIVEIRKEQYYVKVTYIYYCLEYRYYTEVTYTNHEDICWHKDIYKKQNGLCD